MAEKASQFQYSTGSSKPRASRHKSVKVVHIENSTMVKTTASEFRGIVQFHTGRRKRSAKDRDESTHLKAPKIEGRLKVNFIPRIAEPEIATMSNDRSNAHDHCDINSEEFKHVESQWGKVSDTLSTQIFDAHESIGDGIFWG